VNRACLAVRPTGEMPRPAATRFAATRQAGSGPSQVREGKTVLMSNSELTMRKLDRREVPGRADEVRLFLVERNEISRLPYFLSHYRTLGVGRFFVVDDRSDDGSREFLLEQDDCHVFEASTSFRDSNFGVDWQNSMLDSYGTGQWTLVVDSDELLVYRNCETVKLPELCRFLDREGSTAFFSFMLDMYPGGDLSEAVCVPDVPFYEICPFFDTDYKTIPIKAKHRQAGEVPAVRVIGG
jgi:hypothetical protein